MARDIAAAEALHQHVFGSSDPASSLVDSGRLPLGWADEYRRFLKLDESEWLPESMRPRCLAVAMDNVVTHLDVRYQA